MYENVGALVVFLSLVVLILGLLLENSEITTDISGIWQMSI